jgi:MerR family transcriptional regulator/heat shock protein HspR
MPLSGFYDPIVPGMSGEGSLQRAFQMGFGQADRDPRRPVYVISVAAGIVSVHPRTLRIYEDEGLLCPARTPTNIRLYSDEDIRRIQWIRHLTRDRGVNLAGIKILFELEERLGKRILEALYDEGMRNRRAADASAAAERESGTA